MIAVVRCLVLLALVSAVAMSESCAATIQFDYSRDNGFFAPGPARDALIAAGQVYESLITDSLEGIMPAGSNDWAATFDDPSTGNPTSIFNLNVPADTLIVFVGAYDLTGAAVGLGGSGGASASGSSSWITTVQTRGQGNTSGAGAADYGPWGGMLTVDDQVNWNLDHTLLPQSNQHDLLSVLLHELGHVLGIGLADSWSNQVSGNTFSGSASVAAHGSPVPLSSDGAHWQNGLLSTIFGTETTQEAAFDPSIAIGTRKLLTNLDVAGLADVGWQVNPEPHGGVMIVLGLLAILARRRRLPRS